MVFDLVGSRCDEGGLWTMTATLTVMIALAKILIAVAGDNDTEEKQE